MANFTLNPKASEFRMPSTPDVEPARAPEPENVISRFEFGPALISAALSEDSDEEQEKMGRSSKTKRSPRFQFAKYEPQPVGAPPKPIASPRFGFDAPIPGASPRFTFAKLP